MPLEGRRVVGTAGPCCGGLGVAGYPCAPVLGGEDGREAAARRRRLKSFCMGSSHDAGVVGENGPKSPETVRAQSVPAATSSETLANLWQAALSGSPADALCLVELRGFEPLTPCMPCHPHHFTWPFAALLCTASSLLSEVAGRGTVVRHEAACGIAADNLLTAPRARPGGDRQRAAPGRDPHGLASGRQDEDLVGEDPVGVADHLTVALEDLGQRPALPSSRCAMADSVSPRRTT